MSRKSRKARRGKARRKLAKKEFRRQSEESRLPCGCTMYTLCSAHMPQSVHYDMMIIDDIST